MSGVRGDDNRTWYQKLSDAPKKLIKSAYNKLIELNILGSGEFLKDPIQWVKNHSDNPVVNAIASFIPGASAGAIVSAMKELQARESKRLEEEKEDTAKSTAASHKLNSLSGVEQALHGTARKNVRKDIKAVKSELTDLAKRESQRNRESQYDYTRMYQAGNMPAGFLADTAQQLENKLKGE